MRDSGGDGEAGARTAGSARTPRDGPAGLGAGTEDNVGRPQAGQNLSSLPTPAPHERQNGTTYTAKRTALATGSRNLPAGNRSR